MEMIIWRKSDIDSTHAIVISVVVGRSRQVPFSYDPLGSDADLTMHHGLATIELKWTN